MLQFENKNQIESALKDLQTKVAEVKGKKELLQEQAIDFEESTKFLNELNNDLKEAIDVVNIVLSLTQEKVNEFVGDIVTLALQYVHGDDYSFELEQVVERNKASVGFVIYKSDIALAPDEVGGGVLDVASFGLRLAFWAMNKNRTSSVFLLDEPAKFVSLDKKEGFGKMLEEVSSLLEIQLIIISHDEALIDTADRSFRVVSENKISSVEEI